MSREDEITFERACEVLETTLAGTTRQEILARLTLSRLREGMRTNRFKAGANQLVLDGIVKHFEARTRQDGFNVLHDWDGKADTPNEEIIPVDVLNFVDTTFQNRTCGETTLSILLDYYFMYVLALLALRAWDEGDANRNLDRLTGLLESLQGSNGSGHRFADNSQTLIFIATSHFEPDEKAYFRLLEKIQLLDESHQLSMALTDAAILSSHLRFGFEPFYRKDLSLMRADNGPDYPWLCFSLSTLMRTYSHLLQEGIQGIERDKVVEGLLNGLGPDTRAFVGKAPANLAGHEAQYQQFRELFYRHRQELLEEFEKHRPSREAYSPISFSFNFPHNIVKAMVVDAAFRGEGWSLTLNDLLSGFPAGERGERTEKLARTLMAYALVSPEKLKGRDVPIIVYDPYAGIRAFTKTIGLIKEHPPQSSS